MVVEYVQQMIILVQSAWMHVSRLITEAFVLDVIKALVGTFIGAVLGYWFSKRRDKTAIWREQKAAGNVAMVTLLKLASDFLRSRIAIMHEVALRRTQVPSCPRWLLLRPLHFAFANARFDMQSLIFLMEYRKRGARVIERLIQMELAVHDFFGQIAVHAEAVSEAQDKFSALGKMEGSVEELQKIAGPALVGKIDSFMSGIEQHLAKTEADVRAAADELGGLLRSIFGEKGVVQVTLPSDKELRRQMGVPVD